MTIAENIRSIKARIERAARRAGRDASAIKLVAVTKGVSVDRIIEAVRAGITDIGENRVQEAYDKIGSIRDLPVTRHMIGHLQTNKVKKALEMFSVIQSVDSEKLAEEINGGLSAIRKDEVISSHDIIDELIGAAPDKKDDYIKVKTIL